MADDRPPRAIKSEILPPVRSRVQDEPIETPERKPGEMVNIDLPPSGLIRTAFFTAIEYRMKNKAAEAYNQCLTTLKETRSLLDDLNWADVESERVFRYLEDAEEIHRADAADRKEKRIEAERSLQKAQIQAEIDKLRGEWDLVQAREKYSTSSQSTHVSQEFDEAVAELHQEYVESYKKSTDGKLDEKDEVVLAGFERIKNTFLR